MSLHIQNLIKLLSQFSTPVSIRGLVSYEPTASLVIITVILVLFFLLLLLIFQQRRISRQTSLELSKRLRLYTLTDDYFFEYDYHKQILSFSLPSNDAPDGVQLQSYTRHSSADKSAAGKTFWKLIDNCETGIHEFYEFCTDNEHHWLRVAFETIYNKEGQPVYAIGKLNQIDAEITEKEVLQTKAQRDGLTGLYNAQAFQELAKDYLLQMKEGSQAALLLLDIDHFKSINDTYGHMQGDTSLRQLASLLQSSIRQEDIVGRFGGDEFLIFLRTIENIPVLESRCENICQFVRYETAQSGCPFTISLGAVLVHPGSTFNGLFDIADSALYTTKQNGRNNYTILNPDGTPASGSSEKKSSQMQQTPFTPAWIMDKKLETVLRALKAIVFEFHAKTGKQYISSFINEFLPGNYDGRPLSTVMLEDGIIHPEDTAYSVEFREACRRGESGEMTLRLMTQSGKYHWYKMLLAPAHSSKSDIFLGVLIDVDSETSQRIHWHQRANFDPVSNIFNSQAFYNATKKLLEAHPNQEHYLIRFDIDRFKLINELYSTEEGDRILLYIGNLLRECTLPGETYGRLRDDVFALCLTRSREGAIAVIHQLEQRLNETTLAFQFVISAGIVYIPEYHGESISLLCDHAVMAQRTVKGNYLLPYAFYEQSMSDALNREHFITASMRSALENGEFLVYLQPQYDIQTGRMTGAEALARWNHPEKGMIPPGEFIPLFEHSGFILPLDEYIWEQTCILIRKWLDMGYALPVFSINVSRIHLYDQDFCKKIPSLVQKYNLTPQLLHMEITESVYTESPEMLYDVMEELQKQGFSFSMDDFGSGYSSLNVLKDIPVDVVKIDLKFLENSRRGTETGHSILEDTVRLVRNLGLPVIAEGVETEEQLDFLKSIRCNAAQGYYYAKPLSPDKFELLLKKATKENPPSLENVPKETISPEL